MIGQDFELPVQITASPVQILPGVRSLEEELQEAIQKAQVGVCRRRKRSQRVCFVQWDLSVSFFWPQMDPRQSIDDILDEPVTCVGVYIYKYLYMHIINKEFNLNDAHISFSV